MYKDLDVDFKCSKKKNIYDRIAEILSTMSLESDAKEASTVEETDLLRRSVKKQK